MFAREQTTVCTQAIKMEAHAVLRLPLLLLATLLLGGPAVAMYSKSSPVQSLEPSNFQAKIKASGFAVVAFVAPWWDGDGGETAHVQACACMHARMQTLPYSRCCC